MQRILIFSFLLAILAVIFASQNSGQVDIVFFFWTIRSSLALIIIISMAIGAILGITFSIPGRKKKNVIAANKTVEPKKEDRKEDKKKETGSI